LDQSQASLVPRLKTFKPSISVIDPNPFSLAAMTEVTTSLVSTGKETNGNEITAVSFNIASDLSLNPKSCKFLPFTSNHHLRWNQTKAQYEVKRGQTFYLFFGNWYRIQDLTDEFLWMHLWVEHADELFQLKPLSNCGKLEHRNEVFPDSVLEVPYEPIARIARSSQGHIQWSLKIGRNHSPKIPIKIHCLGTEPHQRGNINDARGWILKGVILTDQRHLRRFNVPFQSFSSNRSFVVGGVKRLHTTMEIPAELYSSRKFALVKELTSRLMTYPEPLLETTAKFIVSHSKLLPTSPVPY